MKNIVLICVVVFFSFCKASKKIQNQTERTGFRPREETINPNRFSFYCDSFINEKELRECLVFLFNTEHLATYRQKTNDSDFYFIAWQNKNAIPYCFTLKPSFRLYKINCDSLYEKKYLAYVMFSPTLEDSTRIEIELSEKMTYYYWSIKYITLEKDINGMYCLPRFLGFSIE
jgi:hypothetical protein